MATSDSLRPFRAAPSAEYTSGSMAVLALQSIVDMAAAIEAAITTRPAPWVEFKVSRSKQALRDVVLYASQFAQNPGGAHTRESLIQIQEDAHWLLSIVDPSMELMEWTMAYLYETQADLEDVYVRLVRASDRMPNPCDLGYCKKDSPSQCGPQGSTCMDVMIPRVVEGEGGKAVVVTPMCCHGADTKVPTITPKKPSRARLKKKASRARLKKKAKRKTKRRRLFSRRR